MFESLCIRDLKAYSANVGGELSYYHDRYDLEADAVLHLEDGRYALIEIKLSESQIDEGAKHLCEIEKLVKEFNEKYPEHKMKLPEFKMIVTGTTNAKLREDGIYVVPLACLKP